MNPDIIASRAVQEPARAPLLAVARFSRWGSLLAGMALVATCWASPARATELQVEVQGIPDASGNVLIAACAIGEAFPVGPCAHVATATARAGSISVTLHDLPGGRYALSAFQDRDGNQQLGRNWLGIPTECIGFGNNAPIGRFGPPAFVDAAVSVPAAGAMGTAITLRCR